jgi:glutathione synthase/RimK-type ligase-like ATP-grasp enzyme
VVRKPRGRRRRKIVIITQEIDPHADVMALRLQKRGVQAVRFHPQAIGRSDHLTYEFRPRGKPRWQLQGAYGTLRDIDVGSVWYRRPLFALDSELAGDEAQFAQAEIREAVLGLFRLTEAFWVNHPDALRVAESKPLRLKVAEQLGFRVPHTLVTNDPQKFQEFYEKLQGAVIFKVLVQGPLGASQGKGVYTSLVRPHHLKEVETVRRVPCLFQEHIPKAMDLRVTVIGEQVFPVEIHSQDQPEAQTDWRKGDAMRLKHSLHRFPAKIERQCLALVKNFKLEFGAIDLVLTPQGEYVFLEINPSGQFAWIEALTKIPLVDALADLLQCHT